MGWPTGSKADIKLSKGLDVSAESYQTRVENATRAFLKGAGPQREKTLAEAAEEALKKLSKWDT